MIRKYCVFLFSLCNKLVTMKNSTRGSPIADKVVTSKSNVLYSPTVHIGNLRRDKREEKGGREGEWESEKQIERKEEREREG